MNKREQQKKNTRELIKKKAKALFIKNGFNTTSTQQIAKEAEIAHGTLFIHFPQRDDLITEIIEEFLGRLAKRLQSKVERSETIKSYLQAYVDGLAKEEILYYRIISEIDQLPDFAHATLLSIQSSISIQMFTLLAKEVDSNSVKVLPQDLLFNTWIALINHYLLNKKIFTTKTRILPEKSEELIDFFIELISKD